VLTGQLESILALQGVETDGLHYKRSLVTNLTEKVLPCLQFMSKVLEANIPFLMTCMQCPIASLMS